MTGGNRRQTPAQILRSRQKNPCDHLYWKSKGYPERPLNWKELLEQYINHCENDQSSEYYEDNKDSSEEYDENEANRRKSNQNNPNNVDYWYARGYSERPSNWHELVFGR